MSPANPVALLGLAWAHEVHGEYEQASELLQKLVENEPGNAHARLRLAVCERRLGDPASAEANFRRVLAQETEPWIRSIAHQELTRTLLSQGDVEGAARQARTALEESPGDEEAAILLASISERLGRVAEADAIIGRIVPAPSDQPSARYVYDRRPDLEIEAARAKLHAMMDERLELLASGLRWWGAGTAPEEGESR
jgi:Flp pilus assembly protein TadD